MPKLTNKGFGLIPVLLIVSALTVLSFVGYYSYTNLLNPDSIAMENSSSESEEDVLQAASEGGFRDINTFLYRTLFNSANLGEFNRNNTALIVTMSQNLDKCFFAQRSSKPLTVRFPSGGKVSAARIHQNVSMQILPNSMASKKYMVVIPNPGSEIKFTEKVSLIQNSCGANVYILEQPEEVTSENFVNYISTDNTGTNPGAMNNNAKITVESKENQTIVIVSSATNNTLVHDYFKNRGITVLLSNKRPLKVNKTDCSDSGCGRFSMVIPHGSPHTSTKNESIAKISFPYVSTKAEYEIEVLGKTSSCEQPNSRETVIEKFSVSYNKVMCSFGMLN